MRIVFWGSSDFSLPSLTALYGRHQISAIVTQPDHCIGRGNKEYHRTPMKLFQPETLKDGALLTHLTELAPDLSVIVSYGKIIPDSLIYLPKYHTINLHASLLPKYRGASPIQYALLHGDTVTGNTVQFITKELDKGDIIVNEQIPIEPGDDYLTLTDKLGHSGAGLLLRALEQIESGNCPRIPQEHSEATYCKIIRREDGLVRFEDETAETVYGKSRAFHPWPGIFCDYVEPHSRKQIRVSFTKIAIDDKILGQKGTVLKADREGLVIGCKEKSIRVEAIKPAGKSEMSASAFINGYKPVPGKVFSLAE